MFIRGHAGGMRANRHDLTNLDWDLREADCSQCGRVTFKKDAGAREGIKCTRQLSTQHRIVDVDEETQTAFCRACKERVRVTQRRSKGVWVCFPAAQARDAAYRAAQDPEVRRAQMRAWQEANREHVRNETFLRNYGITVAERDTMVAAQDNRCAICNRPPDVSHRGSVLHVDHDHDTGAVRGMLCSPCNIALGGFEDDIDRLLNAVSYLRKHQSTPPQTAGS